MENLSLLGSVIVGILAGAIAGWLVKGSGFGLTANLIVGLVGSVLGGRIYGLLGLSAGSTFGVLIMSVVGAVALLWIVSFVKKRMG